MADTIAIIKTGGKQYKVHEGQRLKIEKLPQEEGEDVIFKDVLMVARGDKVSVGTPTVEGATVTAKLLKQDRSKKVIVFKMRPKKRYRVKNGHRQSYTEVEITKI